MYIYKDFAAWSVSIIYLY